MNGTMFFNVIGTQEQNVFSKNRGRKEDLQIIENNAKDVEMTTDKMGLPLNVVNSPYKNEGIEKVDNNVCLYRPISPNNEENFTPYAYSNSSSPTQEGSNYTPINGQTIVFGKYSHLTTDMFGNATNFYNSNNNNLQYLLNNNNHRQNNNVTNNNHSRQGKGRFNHQNNNHSNSNNGQNREHRRRPLNSYHRYTPDVMIRRAHGLTNRFKSRSDVMKIDPNPSQLLNGGIYDQLSQAIWDVFISKAQKIETYENKIQLWKNLFLYIRRCVSHYALYIVGSTMTGFGLNTSDIDMCLLIRPFTEDPRLDSLHQLYHIKDSLLKYGLIMNSEVIMAKVPILKFREQSTGFEIDLNCNNSVGIYNTHLLYCYARCDWRVRPLVVMVKLWAQSNGINDAKNLTVSSYSWTLMVIHYLQYGVSPAVLPCLHALYPEHFDADKCKITDVHENLESLEEFESFNIQTLAELFIGFFGYYTNFDFAQYAISVRAGGCLLIEDCKMVKAPKNDQNQWKYMCIEEPFDFTNTARSVYDIAAFRHIRNVIRKSYEELVRTKMLNSVLPVVIGPECSAVIY